MRFIDLFAGLGGFHLALKNLGHSCVFASEVQPELQSLYELNFGLRPAGAIRKVRPEDIPSYDILCAGSPCQPFSKAGEQNGLSCPKWGDLFDFAVAILEHHKPRYLLLENVSNLTRHNGGKTWQAIQGRLETLGYETDYAFLSPHQFGIPQIRERVFIVGSRSRHGLGGFVWPKPIDTALSIQDVLDNNPDEARRLPPHVRRCLGVWQRFIREIPRNDELPAFPIWLMEVGAAYPYRERTPHALVP